MLAAVAHLVAAVVSAAVLTAVSWSPPQQKGSAPWVADVPPSLLVTLVLYAVVFGAAALVLARHAAGRSGTVRLAAVLVAGCVAAGWNALYAACFGPDDNPIPVFDWLFSAIPVLLAARIVCGGESRLRRIAVGLLVAAPLWGLSIIGWGVQMSTASAAQATVVFQGFGTALALAIAAAPGSAPGDRGRNA